jgi:hypothetical protein
MYLINIWLKNGYFSIFIKWDIGDIQPKFVCPLQKGLKRLIFENRPFIFLPYIGGHTGHTIPEVSLYAFLVIFFLI